MSERCCRARHLPPELRIDFAGTPLWRLSLAWLPRTGAPSAPVYRLFGFSRVAGDDLPTLDEPLPGDVGFMVHDGEYPVLPADFEAMTRFMAFHFNHA